MQLVKVLCVALVGLTLAAAAVSANVADGANEKAAVHDKCGAKGGHCEAVASCGGRKLKGLCDDNGSGNAVACCVPGKTAKKGRGLSPKQLAAKRKARAAEAKKQAKAAAAAGAAMAAQTAMAKALAKDVPAPAGKNAVPAQPTAAEADKAAAEGAAVAKAAAPQPPAAAKKVVKKALAKKLKAKKAKKAKGKGKNKKAAAKKKSNTAKLGMRVKKGSRGIDVAQKTTKKQWQCLKKAGWDWAVVRGFRSSNRPDPHAPRSLKLAAKAGFGRRKLGVYLYPCANCGDAKGQVDRMIKHLKNHGAHRLFSTIWLDVEGRFWPAPKPTRKQRAAALAAKRAAAVAAAKVNTGSGNTGIVPPPAPPVVKKPKTSSRYGEARAFFRSLVRACRAHKRYRCGVYTSAQQWQSIMGKRPLRMAARMPLWYPQFDVTPSAATSDFEGFSGWDNAWAKQYSENQNVCGLSADVNVRA